MSATKLPLQHEVFRTTDTSVPLTVNLQANPLGQASVVGGVGIAAGQSASLPFRIEAVNDDIVDGAVLLTITASAVGLASGTDTIVVPDDDVPLIDSIEITRGLDQRSIVDDFFRRWQVWGTPPFWSSLLSVPPGFPLLGTSRANETDGLRLLLDEAIRGVR